jgi:hypothetical protein
VKRFAADGVLWRFVAGGVAAQHAADKIILAIRYKKPNGAKRATRGKKPISPKRATGQKKPIISKRAKTKRAALGAINPGAAALNNRRSTPMKRQPNITLLRAPFGKVINPKSRRIRRKNNHAR